MGAFGLRGPWRFNSRSRVGSDLADLAVDAETSVSIHAPAWGATFRLVMERPWMEVSIHAPAWGATFSARALAALMGFQFTLPRGERLLRPILIILGLLFQFTLPRGERPRGFASPRKN